MIIFFRGKAATGKSTVARYLRETHGLASLTKDQVFDQLLLEGMAWEEANQVTYDHLANKIQAAHDQGQTLVVDIGLAHTPYFETFLSKMNLSRDGVIYHHFICSDDQVWSERIHKRVLNPEGPNQFFKSVEEAFGHYNNYQMTLLSGEHQIDSARSLSSIQEDILKKIGLLSED